MVSNIKSEIQLLSCECLSDHQAASESENADGSIGSALPMAKSKKKQPDCYMFPQQSEVQAIPHCECLSTHQAVGATKMVCDVSGSSLPRANASMSELQKVTETATPANSVNRSGGGQHWLGRTKLPGSRR